MNMYVKYAIFISLIAGQSSFVFARSIFKELSSFNKKNKESFKCAFDNFYEVENGKFYRSQQLSDKKLAHYLKKFKIKTLINLRGDDETDWWLKEKKVAEDQGVCFFSLPMSAVYLTERENLLALLNIYEYAPTPILVHCIGGADRTGEASAIWVLEHQKKGNKEALEQLSIKYGHRKFKNSAKDWLIGNWRGKEWVSQNYNPQDYPQYCRPK